MGRYRVRSGDLNIAGVLLLACAALLLSAVAVYVVVRGMSPVPAQVGLGRARASGSSTTAPLLGCMGRIATRGVRNVRVLVLGRRED